MFCIQIKTLSSGISLEYLTTPLIALHNKGEKCLPDNLAKKKIQLNNQEKPQNI